MANDERLFKLLLQCNRRCVENGSKCFCFTVGIKRGFAFVECRGYETYVQTVVFDENGRDTMTEFVGTTVAAANRLETLGADFDTINMG